MLISWLLTRTSELCVDFELNLLKKHYGWFWTRQQPSGINKIARIASRCQATNSAIIAFRSNDDIWRPGTEWRSKFKSFVDKPFAAASIGQVHRAVLHDGNEVAIKIQYMGVAQSINSDMDNLVGMLRICNLFPPGAFIDDLIDVVKRELAWEVDYLR